MLSIPACASGLILALLIHLCAGRWNFLDDNGHRIRHKRNWKVDRYQYEEPATCPAKRDNREYISCPKQRCHTNQDCWTETGSARRCFCDRYLCGLVCISIDATCEPLGDLKNGKIDLSPIGLKGSPQPGGQANYTCNDGFTLKGPRIRMCKANGRWTDTEPTCASQQFCDRPPPIIMAENNATSAKRFLAGEIVKYWCRQGYSSTIGYSIKICNGDSGWTGQELKCKRKKCQMPQPLRNGKYINQGLHYKGKIIYVCQLGYRLVCNSDKNRNDCQVRVCQADGRWSGHDGHCEKIRCPELLVPLNGKILGTPNSSSVNSIITFECDKGFYLKGSKTRRCQKEGKWDGEDAICKIWNCGMPTFVPFAKMKYSGTLYESTVKYTCQENSSFVGDNAVLRCGQNGFWIPKTPKCLSHCTLLKVSNGTIHRIGNKTNNDKGNPQLVPHGTTISVNCSVGYKLKDNVHPLCDNGSWSEIPVCEPAPCASRPPKGINSKPRFYSLDHASKAVYSCFFGFQRRYGDEVLRCLFGKWVGKPLKCTPTACPKPEFPKNGALYVLGSQASWKFTPKMQFLHNTVIEYRCLKNYRRNGPRTAVCLNRQWRPNETPNCEFILHKKLPLSWVLYKPRKLKQPS